jgi:hypothetical protein
MDRPRPAVLAVAVAVLLAGCPASNSGTTLTPVPESDIGPDRTPIPDTTPTATPEPETETDPQEVVTSLFVESVAGGHLADDRVGVLNLSVLGPANGTVAELRRATLVVTHDNRTLRLVDATAGVADADGHFSVTRVDSVANDRQGGELARLSVDLGNSTLSADDGPLGRSVPLAIGPGESVGLLLRGTAGVPSQLALVTPDSFAGEHAVTVGAERTVREFANGSAVTDPATPVAVRARVTDGSVTGLTVTVAGAPGGRPVDLRNAFVRVGSIRTLAAEEEGFRVERAPGTTGSVPVLAGPDDRARVTFPVTGRLREASTGGLAGETARLQFISPSRRSVVHRVGFPDAFQPDGRTRLSGVTGPAEDPGPVFLSRTTGNATPDGSVESVRLRLSGRPGGRILDTRDLTVELVRDGETVTLTHRANGDGDAGYGVVSLPTPDNSGPVVDDHFDDVRLELDPGADSLDSDDGPAGTRFGPPLRPNSTATVRILANGTTLVADELVVPANASGRVVL